jgi:uncharacterized protein (TIGR03083 family)
MAAVARLADLQPAYAAQQAALVSWLGALPTTVWDQPSRLAGWTVRDLAFHATDMTAVVVRALAAGPVHEQPLSVAGYTAMWLSVADEIAARDRENARDLDAAGVLENAAAARAELMDALEGVDGDPIIAGRRGPLRLSDLMTTRVNELVVHSLDLSASAPDQEPVRLEPRALGISCRMLTGILAERVPGRTVEVRVPPYAAVQCIAGPRHTRGTPANVVEAPAVIWVELATGRLSWAEALAGGRLQVSGERSDISEHLPVLA